MIVIQKTKSKCIVYLFYFTCSFSIYTIQRIFFCFNVDILIVDFFFFSMFWYFVDMRFNLQMTLTLGHCSSIIRKKAKVDLRFITGENLILNSLYQRCRRKINLVVVATDRKFILGITLFIAQYNGFTAFRFCLFSHSLLQCYRIGNQVLFLLMQVTFFWVIAQKLYTNHDPSSQSDMCSNQKIKPIAILNELGADLKSRFFNMTKVELRL